MTEEELFASLVKLSPDSRHSLLDRNCAHDPALRRRLEQLLEAHDRGHLADQPPPTVHREAADDQRRNKDSDLALTVDPQRHEQLGASVGPYTLEQRLGEGGMGTVWVAKQSSPVKRRVALKLIKAGMDSREVLVRFEHERQALAMMDHPNIAKVLDAGITSSGHPYFAMELVNGLPLTRFCDDIKLTTEQRLEIFTQVCSAVQHAHQKGIIHRDLKPANILVTLIDGKPVPKVIDFGVSKALAGNAFDRTTMTQFGAVIGTLDYMAPEQAAYSGTDIDTRADIYALGVILYELLTGLKPFDPQRMRKAAIDEVIRIIREEEPSKPSTRLSSSDSRPALAAARGLDPSRLARKIRGDLDWIALKCLEKDRNRRYETANQLALEIKRYLADEPVLAGPPTSGYLLRKFLKRNRRQVAVAGLVLVSLIVGLIASLWQMNRALIAERAASNARDAEIKQRKHADELRIKAEASAQRALEGSHQTRAALDAVTDDVVRSLFAKTTKLTDSERQFCNRLLAMYDRLAELDGNDLEATNRRMAGYWRVIEIQTRLGAYDDAKHAFERMATAQEKIANRYPDNPSHRLSQVAMLRGAFTMLGLAGNKVAAEAYLTRAEAALRIASIGHPENLDVREQQITLAHDRAWLMEASSPAREAAFGKLARESEALLIADPERTNALAVVLSCLREQLNELSAQERYDEVLQNGAHQLDLLSSRGPAISRQGIDFILSQKANTNREMGRALAALGREEEAIAAYDRGLEFAKQRRDAGLARLGQWDIVWDQLRMLHTGLAALYESKGRWQEAAAAYRDALAATARWADFVPDQKPLTITKANLQNDLARVLQLGGFREEALAALLTCAEFREAHLDQFDNPRDYRVSVPAYREQAAQLLSDLGRSVESIEQRRKAIELYQALLSDFPAEPPFSLRMRNHIGWIQLTMAKAHLAKTETALGVKAMEQAIATFQEQAADTATDDESQTLQRVTLNGLGSAYHDLAEHWTGRKDLVKARDYYAQAISWRAKYYEADRDDVDALASLAWAWHNQGQVRIDMGEFLSGASDMTKAIQLAMTGPKSSKQLGEIIEGSIHRLDSAAEVRRKAGNPAEALSVFREVLALRQQMAQRNPVYLLHTSWSHHNICLAALDAGKVDEALQAASELKTACTDIAKQSSTSGDDAMNATDTAFKAGKRLLDAGQTAAARELYATRLAIRLELVKRLPDKPGLWDAVMYAHYDMFLAYRTEGNRAAALASMQQSIEAAVARMNKFPDLRESHSNYDTCVNSICTALRETEEYPVILQVVNDYRKQSTPDRPGNSSWRSSILAYGGRAALAIRKNAEAETILREAMDEFDATLPNDWQAYNIRCYLGQALLAQDKIPEAEAMFSKGYEGMFARRASIPRGNTFRLRVVAEQLMALAEIRNSSAEVEKWRRELKFLEGDASPQPTKPSDQKPSP